MTYGYLADLALILLATKALSMLTGKLQMPQVVGALVAGLVMGPAVLNIIQPSDFLSQVAELGMIVIMFSAGMGTDLNELKQTGNCLLYTSQLLVWCRCIQVFRTSISFADRGDK